MRRCAEFDAVTRRDRRLGKAGRAHRRRRDDDSARGELVETHELDAAELERHAALHQVAIRAALPASTGRQKEAADQRRLEIIRN